MHLRRHARVPALLVTALLLAGGVTGAMPLHAEAAGTALVSHGNRSKPVVALTFDDGYNTSNCQKILDILERRKVNATFFPVGRAVLGGPRFWRSVSAAGFPIANHTLSHPVMTHLDYAGQLYQIDQGRRAIESVIGKVSVRIMRPPTGAWNQDTLNAANAAGYRIVALWDASDADTSSRGSDADHIRTGLKGTNGSIVLLHCGPDITPRILEPIIDGYLNRGFGFVTVPQLFGMNGPVPFPVNPPLPTPAPTPVPTPTPPLELSDGSGSLPLRPARVRTVAY